MSHTATAANHSATCPSNKVGCPSTFIVTQYKIELQGVLDCGHLLVLCSFLLWLTYYKTSRSGEMAPFDKAKPGAAARYVRCPGLLHGLVKVKIQMYCRLGWVGLKRKGEGLTIVLHYCFSFPGRQLIRHRIRSIVCTVHSCIIMFQIWSGGSALIKKYLWVITRRGKTGGGSWVALGDVTVTVIVLAAFLGSGRYMEKHGPHAV